MGSEFETLEKAAIVQGLDGDDLKILLQQCHTAQFRCNETVVKDNATGREIYIVLSGEVTVTLDPARLGTIERGSIDQQVIRRIPPGGSFGEMAFLTGELRTASVIVTSPITELLVIPFDSFDKLPKSNLILRNIAREVAQNLRSTNERMISTLVSGYFLTALVEQLATGAHVCSLVAPLEKLVVIRHRENFILSGPGQLLQMMPDKEAIEIAFFAEPAVLTMIAGAGAPPGTVIFNALWSVLRSGSLSERIPDSSLFSFHTSQDRRVGSLAVQKTIDGRRRVFHLHWQIKGAHYDVRTNTSSAHLELAIFDHEEGSRASRAEQVVAGIAMPVLKRMRERLIESAAQFTRTRVLVIHHRTHEVARTLETLAALGFQIQGFIGIPYGEADWEYVTMLDHVSGHKYLTLKLMPDSIDTRYAFDFRQSSFLDMETEQEFQKLYADPSKAHSYVAAMDALAENRLIDALRTSLENGQQLIIYEDGGYIASKIYEISAQTEHPAHSLLKSSLDRGTIRGIVEVTVAGERRNLSAIEQNAGRVLLPVLSNARSDVKASYEAKGVGEAVIHAAATSLGRLGLPTFQTRRIACIGGNGAIGTRLVEQLAALHNGTANIFVVDVARTPFSIELNANTVPYAAARLRKTEMPRFQVRDDCLPLRVDSLRDQNSSVQEALQAFLNHNGAYREVALVTQESVPEAEVRNALPGFQLLSTVWNESGGATYEFKSSERAIRVSLLPKSTVLAFAEVSRLIREGIDTIIGSTGLSIFNPRDLDQFFIRSNPDREIDELVLISASSKDNEFRHAIEILNGLAKLQSQLAPPLQERIETISKIYENELSLVQDEDFAELRDVFAGCASRECMDKGRLVELVARKIQSRLTIRKEVRPDIGSIFHLKVNGKCKRVVLLADGLVINFFARHEKGVKTEFIDPIVTMQMLSVVQLATRQIEPGLHRMESVLDPQDVAQLWSAVDDNCRPLYSL